MKRILIIYLLASTSAFSQNNFRFTSGIVLGYDLLQPYQFVSKYEYFNSVYSNGGSVYLGVSNKLNYKKIFTRIDVAYNYAFQQQTFVFSNYIDLSIDRKVRHEIPHWFFDWSLGRDFQLNKSNRIQIELGLTTIFDFTDGTSSPQLTRSGSFRSTYSDEDFHSSQEMNMKEYNYEITYDRAILVSPFIKVGLELPAGSNKVSIGISAKFRRLVYDNFIYLSSDTYSAIARSRSQSSSLGFFITYQFGGKSK